MATNNSLNALQDNIRRKGQNAYYYAHGKTIETPIVAYDHKPRKLDVEADDVTDRTAKYFQPISRYSWDDSKKSVKVYVTLSGLDDLSSEDIRIDHNAGEKSLTMKITNLGKKKQNYELILNKLYEEVEKVSFKKKSGDRICLILRKAEEKTWFELQRK